jgi:hypothetical protein
LAPGAVLVIGVPSDVVTSARPRIVAWQLTQFDQRCCRVPLAAPVKNRREAEKLGQQLFPFIVRWQRVDPAAYVGIAAPMSASEPAGEAPDAGANECASVVTS